MYECKIRYKIGNLPTGGVVKEQRSLGKNLYMISPENEHGTVRASAARVKTMRVTRNNR